MFQGFIWLLVSWKAVLLFPVILVTKGMGFKKRMGYCYPALVKPHVSSSLAVLQSWYRARLDRSCYSFSGPQKEGVPWDRSPTPSQILRTRKACHKSTHRSLHHIHSTAQQDWCEDAGGNDGLRDRSLNSGSAISLPFFFSQLMLEAKVHSWWANVWYLPHPLIV